MNSTPDGAGRRGRSAPVRVSGPIVALVAPLIALAASPWGAADTILVYLGMLPAAMGLVVGTRAAFALIGAPVVQWPGHSGLAANSAAGGACLAVLVVLVAIATYAAMTWLHTSRSWWAVLTLFVVVQPGYAATLSRVAGRVAGTVAGAVAAAGVLTLGNALIHSPRHFPGHFPGHFPARTGWAR